MKNNLLIAAAFLLLPATLIAQKDSLKAVIEKQPANVEAHKEYVSLMEGDSAGLVKQYQLWLKKFPKTAAVPYGLGSYYASREDPAAKPYLLKAVTLDPKLADAWFRLSFDAQCWGEFKKSEEYMGNAVKAAPDNPDYLFQYAYSLLETNPVKADEQIKILYSKFPQSQRWAQMLYWRAILSTDQQQRIDLYEQLRESFPMASTKWAAWGMRDYIDLLLGINADTAAKMASLLLQQPGLDSSQTADLETGKQLSLAFVQAQTLLAAHQPAAASDALKGLTVNMWEEQSFFLLKGRIALEAGGPKQAYDTLMACYIKAPARRLKDTLLYYGGKVGKTENTVYKEIKQQLLAGAKQADFKLTSYLSSGQASMSDYKGKVVLFTFWFPGCGPCRDEFPHFERVLKRFREYPVSYIGVNIARQQDSYVIPFMKSSGYSFMPLKDMGANRHNLPVWGAPTNYLIDQEGRIIFKGFRVHDEESEKMLQDMIQLLLHKTV
ncbi:TlpA disulfide reductase family protein [Chitinophaga sp. S165]|uniref:TlpA disulfide reductase family protein n=1 Tax=Chitinophaga sp. S165 TaxID=2135462 RepID=UPI000D709142|nr:TlpA disulfide reductase family protein [Chitinophaga sp. S165]PWV56836.1 thiol-disulfide isomerase/thioredoxin [Chitinophaga sp. S165]